LKDFKIAFKNILRNPIFYAKTEVIN